MPVTLNQVARQLHDMAWEAKTEAESLRESSPELWSKYPGRDNPDWLDGYAAALEHASKHVLNASTVHIRLREQRIFVRGMYDGWSRAGKVVSLPDEERRKTPDRPFAVQFDRLPDEHWPTPLPRARTFATIERAREVAAETAAGGRACWIVRYGTDLCEDFLPAGEAMRGAASPQP